MQPIGFGATLHTVRPSIRPNTPYYPPFGSMAHGSLNRRHLTPGVEAVFEAGGTFLDFRSKLPPKGKYQNGEPNSYPITADFT